ncbi:Nucleotidyltransferase/DNA polymerase involved in DNA repair [Candidatus Roizmanbacteria bacterium]|nr:Nucleotidyltransferase/DNA polymerase involved in DNA repair [Candidatus Roizmanbacteria bacterium]
MGVLLNKADPMIVHVDLNSCFATVEQQAHPSLRGKPVVIAAYVTDRGCILSPSIEAKKLGIKTGMKVYEAKKIYPNVIVRDTDPIIVRDVHSKFMKIFGDYSPHVIPKSIDEAIIDFSPVFSKTTDLVKIGKEIKNRMRQEIGDWISCNIGIATNRFLAKTAASLHKPDGLDLINYKNLKQVYASIKLTDLHGINTRFEYRLNANGINSPLDFFQAEVNFLKKNVFKSITGYYWYLRLHGWEIDDFESTRKSFGQEYSLKEKTEDPNKLKKIIMKLCEKMGRRLRQSNQLASGIHLGVLYQDYSFWHRGKKINKSIASTKNLFEEIMILFFLQPKIIVVSKISVSCFSLNQNSSQQLALIDLGEEKTNRISGALDKINDRFGEFTITPAIMMDMKDTMVDRIAFGKS